MNDDLALVVIDVQKGMFGPEEIVHQPETLLQHVNQVIDQARAADLPVIFIQHSGQHELDPLNPANQGWPLHQDLHRNDGDPVIHKTVSDSFQETNLREELEARGIKRLIIAGCQTDYCVNATSRRAHNLGYDVTVVQDAHSTTDSEETTAAEIIAAHNQAFTDEGIAQLVNADQIGALLA